MTQNFWTLYSTNILFIPVPYCFAPCSSIIHSKIQFAKLPFVFCSKRESQQSPVTPFPPNIRWSMFIINSKIIIDKIKNFGKFWKIKNSNLSPRTWYKKPVKCCTYSQTWTSYTSCTQKPAHNNVMISYFNLQNGVTNAASSISLCSVENRGKVAETMSLEFHVRP